MKILIRPYRSSDFANFISWWRARSHEVEPTADMIPETYWVAVVDGQIVASFGMITTNLKKVCYSVHLVSDPNSNSLVRRAALKALVQYVSLQAYKGGFQNLLAFSYQPKLTERFKDLGFTQTLSNLTSFCKSL